VYLIGAVQNGVHPFDHRILQPALGLFASILVALDNHLVVAGVGFTLDAGLLAGLIVGLGLGLGLGLRKGGRFVLLQRVAHRRLAQAEYLPHSRTTFWNGGSRSRSFAGSEVEYAFAIASSSST
jgi:hypothetical protein